MEMRVMEGRIWALLSLVDWDQERYWTGNRETWVLLLALLLAL